MNDPPKTKNRLRWQAKRRLTKLINLIITYDL